ncbi:aquaporin family protein [Alteromonas sediminis]|uniref:Aquaporin family protein n=1 Tax=Alteromonas sediminis TaxID=2259342 RepID=A0A3N5YMK6_9ALTE|nr:MIP/aquaporin family protein [Alteromonas sediminis]RPJ66661.1 aquaporin family protein [Alteromonas sediminis]
MTFSLERQLVAEFLGTLLLVCTVVGSGIMADQLSSGNVAIALLGNTIPTGAILVVLIMIFGPVSGAHFNPAVTLVFWLKKHLNTRSAILYCSAQVIGAVAGTIVAHLMFEWAPVELGTKPRTGISQWFSEGVATFGLLATILGFVKFKEDAVAYGVGLYITAAYWFTASTSFANPAVTIGRSFTTSFSGIAPTNMPGFVVAQLIGACLALVVFNWLLQNKAR